MLTEYRNEVRRTMAGMAVWGVLAAAGLCLTQRQYMLPGFLLGLSSSFCYYALLSFRVRQSAEMPPEKVVSYMRMGWLVRLSFIVLVLILALIMPGIGFLPTIIGLFSFQIIMVLQAALVVAASLGAGLKPASERQFFRKKE